ncbi:MAG: RdgB/HAM1 family non-canonical purine NTP pyrophosphatase [Chlorobium sp.]|nr:RdgB/HAM1 family non-canonical purine NTP pyrophosphatase [Chlorobium sp.]
MSNSANNRIAIILATGNHDKVRELRPLLEKVSPLFNIFALHELGVEVEVEESEKTLEGNALLKARAIFDLLSERFPFMIALADDTGLEVDALNGAPGVYSARYAPMPEGQTPTYGDNVNHLLQCMSGMKNRTARFRSVIALKGSFPSPQGTIPFEKMTDGVVHGTITIEPSGDDGFGYDPVFMVDSMGKTYSEMSCTEKNSLSHRAIAVQKAIVTLQGILETQNIFQPTTTILHDPH